MPSGPRNATLDLRNYSSTDAGWVNVNASNGQPYSYCYAGGDDNAGGMTVRIGQGVATLTVRSIADHRYDFGTPTFTGPGSDQMSAVGSAQTVTITDRNDAEADVKYTIPVTDTGNGNCTIACDPAIKNVPPDR